MVRGIVEEHVYRHPWERVTAATWRKYSDPVLCSKLSDVQEVDTISRKLDKEAAQLCSKRVITMSAPGPWWLHKIMGSKVCHCMEESVVDGKNRSMEMTTRNVNLRQFVEVEEKCSYSPHPDNEAWTMSKQETNIKCVPLSGFAAMTKRIEQQCIENFVKNIARGREVVEGACSVMEQQSAGFR